MKRNLFSMACVLLTLIVLMGCATSKEKAARKTEQADRVESALAERHYKIAVNMMIDPSETEEKVNQLLPQPYRLEVRNDSLISFLPKNGYNMIMNILGQRGLILFEPIDSYQEVLTKKGRRHIEIGVENEEDSYTFLIDVATDGNSYISVYPRKRERISFYGNLILD